MEMEKTVEELVRAFDVISNDINNDILWFNKKLPDVENCFVFIQKHAMAAHDLLKHYGVDWSGVEILLKTDEYAQRLTLVAQSAFIFSLSAVEYFLKLIIKKSRKGPLVDWVELERAKEEKKGRKFRIYLSGIMKESKRNELIDKFQHDSWKGMIGLRNVIMHNNAVVDEDTTFKIGGLVIETKAGKMVRHPLMNRPKTIKVLVSLTRTWIEAYLKSHTI